VKINLKSKVAGHWKNVYAHFNEKLFRYLLPPGAKLLRFDGSSPGNIVHLEFTFPLKAEWKSKITDEHMVKGHACFVDKGVMLPFGLKYWKHIHHVKDLGSGRSLIHDEMIFSTGKKWKDIVYYPFLYMAFLPRIWQHKKYFSRLSSAGHDEI
jgi:ligand-binding SRPBCC domain-containing protein